MGNMDLGGTPPAAVALSLLPTLPSAFTLSSPPVPSISVGTAAAEIEGVPAVVADLLPPVKGRGKDDGRRRNGAELPPSTLVPAEVTVRDMVRGSWTPSFPSGMQSPWTTCRFGVLICQAITVL